MDRNIMNEWHYSGVHLYCASKGTKQGDGTSRDCPKAGKVDQFHDHDFEGTLICGCPDFSASDF